MNQFHRLVVHKITTGHHSKLHKCRKLKTSSTPITEYELVNCQVNEMIQMTVTTST